MRLSSPRARISLWEGRAVYFYYLENCTMWHASWLGKGCWKGPVKRSPKRSSNPFPVDPTSSQAGTRVMNLLSLHQGPDTTARVCACVCMYVWVCICARVCTRLLYACTFVFACVCLCICTVPMHVHMCAFSCYMHVVVWACVCICMCVGMHVCICVCICLCACCLHVCTCMCVCMAVQVSACKHLCVTCMCVYVHTVHECCVHTHVCLHGTYACVCTFMCMWMHRHVRTCVDHNVHVRFRMPTCLTDKSFFSIQGALEAHITAVTRCFKTQQSKANYQYWGLLSKDAAMSVPCLLLAWLKISYQFLQDCLLSTQLKFY